eukprot:SAG31_NODE_1555_length_7895_cov_46.107748_8_plen_447_part_00
MLHRAAASVGYSLGKSTLALGSISDRSVCEATDNPRWHALGCHAVVNVGPGTYDLNQTLQLDERDSNTTWLSTVPGGAKLTGSVRIAAGNAAVKWKRSTNAGGNIWSADLSSVLPSSLLQSLRMPGAERQPSNVSHMEPTSSWTYGPRSALINQLFVEGEGRQIMARWPNGDPETTAGNCMQSANGTTISPVPGGCNAWISPEGEYGNRQPPGTLLTKKLNNYPRCEMAYCVRSNASSRSIDKRFTHSFLQANRGESPALGCDQCHTCGTFGPYFVNAPPPHHPVYSGGVPLAPGEKELVYDWGNGSVQSFWSDIFDRPGGFVSTEAAARATTWKNPEKGQVRSYFLVFVPTIREIRDFYRDMQRTDRESITMCQVHMFHGALWGWWAFTLKSVNQSANSFEFGYGGHQEARGWSVTAKSNFYIEGILEELDVPGMMQTSDYQRKL